MTNIRRAEIGMDEDGNVYVANPSGTKWKALGGGGGSLPQEWVIAEPPIPGDQAGDAVIKWVVSPEVNDWLNNVAWDGYLFAAYDINGDLIWGLDGYGQAKFVGNVQANNILPTEIGNGNDAVVTQGSGTCIINPTNTHYRWIKTGDGRVDVELRIVLDDGTAGEDNQPIHVVLPRILAPYGTYPIAWGSLWSNPHSRNSYPTVYPVLGNSSGHLKLSFGINPSAASGYEGIEVGGIESGDVIVGGFTYIQDGLPS